MLSRMLSDTFAPLMQLHTEMNRLFEDFFEDVPSTRPYAAGYPGLNVWEDGDNAYAEAELPGMTLENLEVYVQGNQLTIAGERKIGGEKVESRNWHRRERAQGRFSRSVTLPWEIDADKVEAKLQDGILTVRLPKSESARPRKVKVLTA